MLFGAIWVASFDGLWPFWQPATAYKHFVLYAIDVFASGK